MEATEPIAMPAGRPPLGRSLSQRPASNPPLKEAAQRRAEMILRVRGGQLSATEAARALGISRKTYYKWEQRGLKGLVAGLCARNSGRPASPCDGEKESLRRRVAQMERELQRQEQGRQLRSQLRAEGGKKER